MKSLQGVGLDVGNVFFCACLGPKAWLYLIFSRRWAGWRLSAATCESNSPLPWRKGSLRGPRHLTKLHLREICFKFLFLQMFFLFRRLVFPQAGAVERAVGLMTGQPEDEAASRTSMPLTYFDLNLQRTRYMLVAWVHRSFLRRTLILRCNTLDIRLLEGPGMV